MYNLCICVLKQLFLVIDKTWNICINSPSLLGNMRLQSQDLISWTQHQNLLIIILILNRIWGSGRFCLRPHLQKQESCQSVIPLQDRRSVPTARKLSWMDRQLFREEALRRSSAPPAVSPLLSLQLKDLLQSAKTAASELYFNLLWYIKYSRFQNINITWEITLCSSLIYVRFMCFHAHSYKLNIFILLVKWAIGGFMWAVRFFFWQVDFSTPGHHSVSNWERHSKGVLQSELLDHLQWQKQWGHTKTIPNCGTTVAVQHVLQMLHCKYNRTLLQLIFLTFNFYFKEFFWLWINTIIRRQRRKGDNKTPRSEWVGTGGLRRNRMWRQ